MTELEEQVNEFIYLGPVHINTFGTTLSLGFLAVLILAYNEARLERSQPRQNPDFSLYAIIGEIVGAGVYAFCFYYWISL
ncbi:MAG: prolipoprotein diacylglyceryl transferase family protein [Bacillota bacterium]